MSINDEINETFDQIIDARIERVIEALLKDKMDRIEEMLRRQFYTRAQVEAFEEQMLRMANVPESMWPGLRAKHGIKGEGAGK